MDNLKYKMFALLMLALSSIGFVFLTFFVKLYANVNYFFLIWNLFLAWIPMIFSVIIYYLYVYAKSGVTKNISLLAGGFIWLIFYPNAPYIFTDFIHIKEKALEMPLWAELIMYLTVASIAALITFFSLYIVQDIINERFGYKVGWTFSTIILALSSIGVYMGRFVRWNSWDIISHPGVILAEVFNKIKYPLANRKTIAFSFAFFLLILFMYITVYSFTFLNNKSRLRK